MHSWGTAEARFPEEDMRTEIDMVSVGRSIGEVHTRTIVRMLGYPLRARELVWQTDIRQARAF